MCLLDAHRLCNLSLSLLLLYLRRPERVNGVAWPGLSVSLLCILHCISLTLSTVFLSVYQLYFFQFINCISFSLSTVFLSVYQLHFLLVLQIYLCNPSPALSETSSEAGWSRLVCQCPPAITSFVRHLFLTNFKRISNKYLTNI